jgi:NTE family protein
MSYNTVPKRQTALVLQGGGALGAYNAGVFKALYEKIGKKEGFDIIAGTSSGGMNGAVLVSHFIEKGTWDGGVEKLDAFWDHLSTLSYPDLMPGFKEWWHLWHNIYPSVAPGEAARRYYSAKQFMYTGVPHVYLPQFWTQSLPFGAFPRMDYKFFDPFNIWYVYSNQPLRESLGRFVRFPIATSFDQGQPRLMLVSLDVAESAAVTFDSYPKDYNGTVRESLYGDGHYEYTISYPDGIKLDYVMASSSVPLNYDYARIAGVNRADNETNISHKVDGYFWDGGILSNTPLRELIHWHKDYWFRVKGRAADDAQVPNLDVYIVDIWPTVEDTIPKDHDGAQDRQLDLVMNDKTNYDQKVADIVSDYIKLFQKTKDIALSSIKDQNERKAFQIELDKLEQEETKSRHRHYPRQHRRYKDLISGRFDINVKRIKRSDIRYDIANEMLDFSSNTIEILKKDGYRDAIQRLQKD